MLRGPAQGSTLDARITLSLTAWISCLPQVFRNSAKRRPAYTVAELFCVCGGFSHGFSRTGRFRAIFGNDVKAFALKTFELNHANADVPPIALKGDIREVSDGALIKLLATRGFS